MSAPSAPRIPLPPWARKALSALALVAGVYVVGGKLGGAAPREVELRVDLRALEDAGRAPLAVTVTLLRGDDVVRSLERRYPRSAPRELRETLALPQGAYRARVAVTLENVVLERESDVRVSADAPVVLAAPPPP